MEVGTYLLYLTLGWYLELGMLVVARGTGRSANVRLFEVEHPPRRRWVPMSLRYHFASWTDPTFSKIGALT
jgi:hypothetical protein